MAIKNYAEGGKVMTPSQFATYIYEGGRNDTEATARGLEYLSSIGANPAEGVDIFNQALGTKFGVNDFLRVADEFGYKELSSGAIRPKSEIESTFEERIYQGLTPGVDDDMATLRGLQIAQQAGLSGKEIVDLFNSALGFESGKTFTLDDIPRVEAEMTERLGAPVTIPVDKPIPPLPTKVGAPGPGGLSNLTALNVTGGPGSNINQTGLTSIPRTDFSRLAPQLRMVGQYSPLLAERASAPPIETAFRYLDQGTQDFGDRQAPLGAGQMSPGLRTAFEIGLGPNQYYQNIRNFLADNPTADAIAAAKEEYGVSDVDIQRALASVPKTTAAPTAEEAFKNYIYAGGADATEATTRGLQYARNLGLTPEQSTALFNRALGTDFTLSDYDRVMAENAGLFPSMPQPSMTQVLPTGVTSRAPVTGGLAAATAPGGIGAPKYYENIAGALNTGLDPNQIISEMTKYGITTDDLIAARAKYPGATVQALGNVAAAGGTDSNLTGKDAVIQNQNDEGAKAGGLISRYAGGPVTGSPQYFEEGGEVEPMRKYTPTELGSTFDVSEYIDPETGRFMINEYRRDVVFGKGLEEAEREARARMTDEEREMAMRDLMIRQGRTGREYDLPGITVGGPATGDIRPLNYYYAKGGLADVARYGYAEELRQQGRNGDTILAHINPTEAKMLEAMGGSGTINPRTGLPEYGFSWKKLFKFAAPVLGVIGGPVLGLTLGQTALAAGALSGASTPGKTFDFGRGLQAGLMTYLGGKLGEQVGAKLGTAEAGAATAPTGTGSPPVSPDYGGVQIADTGFTPQEAGGYGRFAESTVTAPTASSSFAGKNALPNVQASSAGQATAAAPSFRQDPLGYLTNAVTSGPAATLEQGLGAAYGSYTSNVAADEAIKAQQEANAILMAQREDEERMRNLFRRTMGPVGPRYARSGGLIAFADGGEVDPVAFEGGGMTAPINQPRMLSGGGDGMSDSIPATIDGTQPARLADGEFVIPADVVADIGNGSSSAGAKRLYGMMDRVRTARHGTTKQPPEIKMNRLMPA
jgi:hypothetical protein